MAGSEQDTGVDAAAGGGVPVDPAPLPTRRQFTAEYRARVLAEYEAAPHGYKAAVLRREGLYQSQVFDWGRERDARMAGRKYSRKSNRTQKSTSKTTPSSRDRENEKLRKENQQLTRELAASRQVVDIMGKLQGLLENLSESTGTDGRSTTR